MATSNEHQNYSFNIILSTILSDTDTDTIMTFINTHYLEICKLFNQTQVKLGIMVSAHSIMIGNDKLTALNIRTIAKLLDSCIHKEQVYLKLTDTPQPQSIIYEYDSFTTHTQATLQTIEHFKFPHYQCWHPLPALPLPTCHVPDNAWIILQHIIQYIQSPHTLFKLRITCKSVYNLITHAPVSLYLDCITVWHDAIINHCHTCINQVRLYLSTTHVTSSIIDCLMHPHNDIVSYILDKIVKNTQVSVAIVKFLMESANLPFYYDVKDSRTIVSFCCEHDIKFHVRWFECSHSQRLELTCFAVEEFAKRASDKELMSFIEHINS